MRIVVQSNSASGSSAIHELTGESIQFGRHPDCEMQIDAEQYPKVSRIHARIEKSNRKYKIVPCSKTNHTLVNNTVISRKTTINPGDNIQLGFTGPEIIVLSLDSSKHAGPDHELESVTNPLRPESRGWDSKTRWISGTALTTVSLFVFIVFIFFKNPDASLSSKTATHPEDHIISTKRAWDEIQRIENDIISKHTQYDENCAIDMAHYYQTVSVQDIDPILKTWVSDVIKASQAIIDSETERKKLIKELELASGENARLTGEAIRDNLAKSNDGIVSNIFAEIVGKAAGQIENHIFTPHEIEKINELYHEQLKELIRSLKQQHARKSQIFQSLQSQYHL